jgi:hypothetical protein
MRSACYVFLAIFLMGSAGLAYADGLPVDPRMDTSDPPCTGASCPSPVGPNQGITFAANAQGGGIFLGTNESASDSSTGQWDSLLLTFKPPSGGVGPISCTSGAEGGQPFDSPCSMSTEDDGTVDLFYTDSCEGDSCPNGIPNNDIFKITLNDLGVTTGSWPAGLTFLGYPNTNPGTEDSLTTTFVPLSEVPEPATLTLMGAGLATLLAKKKLRSRGQSNS